MNNKKNNNHLLQMGELYNIENNTIVIGDKKYDVELEQDLHLDPTGDTIQVIEIEGELYADNLGRVTKLKVKKEKKNDV